MSMGCTVYYHRNVQNSPWKLVKNTDGSMFLTQLACFFTCFHMSQSFLTCNVAHVFSPMDENTSSAFITGDDLPQCSNNAIMLLNVAKTICPNKYLKYHKK